MLAQDGPGDEIANPEAADGSSLDAAVVLVAAGADRAFLLAMKGRGNDKSVELAPSPIGALPGS